MESSASPRPPFDLSPLIETIVLVDPVTRAWKSAPAVSIDPRVRNERGTLYMETVLSNDGHSFASFHLRVVDICVRHLLEYDATKKVDRNLLVVTESKENSQLVDFVVSETHRRTRGRLKFLTVAPHRLTVALNVKLADGTDNTVERSVTFVSDAPSPSCCENAAIVILGNLRPSGHACTTHRLSNRPDSVNYFKWMIDFADSVLARGANVHLIGNMIFVGCFDLWAVNDRFDCVQVKSTDPTVLLQTSNYEFC